MDFYQQLDKLPGVKTTIITGNNRPLYEQLQGRFSSIQVVGYTDKVYEYMGCADVVTKPGGITLFETIRSRAAYAGHPPLSSPGDCQRQLHHRKPNRPGNGLLP